MRPLHLSATNFRSFSDLDFDFTPLTLAAIVGENGVGKSTLLTAVLVALYGTAVGPLDGFVRNGTSGFKLTLDFTAGGETYRVVREYGKAQKVSFSKGGVPLAIDKVREVDAAIVKAVGYDHQSFTLAAWLGQGGLGRFASLDPAARKDWLISALALDIWPRMEAEAKKRLADVRTQAEANKAVLSTLEEADVDEERKALAVLEGLADEAEAELRAAEDAARSAADALAKARPLLSARTQTQALVREAERAVHDAEVEANRQASQAAEAEEKAKVSLPELGDAAHLEEQLRSLNEQRAVHAKMQAERDAAGRALDLAQRKLVLEETLYSTWQKSHANVEVRQCPTCGQDVSGDAARKTAESITADGKRLLEAVKAADAAVAEARSAFDGMSVLADPSAAIERVEREVASQRLLAAKHKERDEARARLSGIIEAVKAAQASLSLRQKDLDGARDSLARIEREAEGIDYDALRLAGEKADSEVTRLRSVASSRSMNVARMHARVEMLEQNADKRAEALAQSQTLARLASDLELLVKAYSKSGVPARILDVAVRGIQSEANEYLGRFASGMMLTINTQRDNKGSGIRETLDIIVTDEAGSRPLDAMSGGEKTRANFALAVGLSRFMARTGGRVESFVVDEPEYLDSRGLNELVTCLHALAADTPLVLVVSHIEGITESLPQKVVVKRGGAGSKAVVS